MRLRFDHWKETLSRLGLRAVKKPAPRQTPRRALQIERLEDRSMMDGDTSNGTIDPQSCTCLCGCPSVQAGVEPQTGALTVLAEAAELILNTTTVGITTITGLVTGM